MKKLLIVLVTIMVTCKSFSQIEIKLAVVGKHDGDSVTVTGMVVDGRYLPASKGSPTLLNVGAKYPNQLLTLVIWGDDRSNFKGDPEKVYMNKTIKVTGKVGMYNSKPQIILYSEKQVIIITELQKDQ